MRESRKLVKLAHQLISTTIKARGKVGKKEIDDAISLLKKIIPKEYDFVHGFEQNEEGLRNEVIINEAQKLVRITAHTIQFLEKKDIQHAIQEMYVILTAEEDIDKIMKEILRSRSHDTELARKVKPILKKYVKKNMKVAELFNSDKTDILEALHELVGVSGEVYGLDGLNPFEGHENMKIITNIPNIHLIRAMLPNWPAPKVDAIIVREFHYVREGSNLKNICQSLDNNLNTGGYIIMLLNRTEYKNELKYPEYHNIISDFPNKYEEVHFDKHSLVFRKK